jgi:hypothetical protein
MTTGRINQVTDGRTDRSSGLILREDRPKDPAAPKHSAEPSLPSFREGRKSEPRRRAWRECPKKQLIIKASEKVAHHQTKGNAFNKAEPVRQQS